MPCYDSRDDSTELHKEINRLTRLLCSTCKALTKSGHGVSSLKVAGLDDWWRQHQKEDLEDAKRKAAGLAAERKNKPLTLKELKARLRRLDAARYQ